VTYGPSSETKLFDTMYTLRIGCIEDMPGTIYRDQADEI